MQLDVCEVVASVGIKVSERASLGVVHFADKDNDKYRLYSSNLVKKKSSLLFVYHLLVPLQENCAPPTATVKQAPGPLFPYLLTNTPTFDYRCCLRYSTGYMYS